MLIWGWYVHLIKILYIYDFNQSYLSDLNHKIFIGDRDEVIRGSWLDAKLTLPLIRLSVTVTFLNIV